MNSQLQKVAEMIKKTFHTKEQEDCFDGCILYVEEHCADARLICMKQLEEKFDKIDKKLDNIDRCTQEIKKVVGINGNDS
ncbi:MAG: hypothetical protein ACTSPI_00715 [Candidatus Heimdallarchaeaceae archaeon]